MNRGVSDEPSSERLHPPPLERVQPVELGVFLILIVPSMALSQVTVEREGLTFSVVAGAVILQNVMLLSLVCFFIWRNGESFRAIGCTLGQGSKEILLGCGLFFPFILVIGFIETILRGFGLSTPEAIPSYLVPSGAMEFLLALIFLVVIAVAEEIVFRGYLILRLKNLTGSIPLAVVLAALIFALGHGYQGLAAVIAVAVMGVLFSLVYLWRGSLVAPMVMHFLQNATSILFISSSLEAA